MGPEQLTIQGPGTTGTFFSPSIQHYPVPLYFIGPRYHFCQWPHLEAAETVQPDDAPEPGSREEKPGELDSGTSPLAGGDLCQRERYNINMYVVLPWRNSPTFNWSRNMNGKECVKGAPWLLPCLTSLAPARLPVNADCANRLPKCGRPLSHRALVSRL